MTRLVVCGAGGRMGTRILELAAGNSKFEIVAGVESRNHPSVGGRILNGKVAVSGDLEEFKNAFDVVIDFTSPEATLSHLKSLRGQKKAAAVVGTTGFSPKQTAQIKNFSKKFPIVIAPNMSLGVNLLLELVRAAAKKLSGYDIEIVEAHHNQKKDAPSGTALALALEIAGELKLNPGKDFIYGRKGLAKRRPGEIAIHSVRAGDIVGEHTVTFAKGGEKIVLHHTASSRDAFASGALTAALWAAKRRPGLYSMKDVLKG